jgi:phage FluMu protein Com
MIDLQTERDTRRATLEPWRCDGSIRGGDRCNRLLMLLDWNRPSFIQVKCSGCGHLNLFVEAHRPV